ncbi:MAG: hypothetical protein E7013_04240 [Alphaproteobacteria bacterium]|nr:hypothetical protein [Alphaproteobacteria bacterium]
MDNLELAQLITTRISHDLSGMLGAVYNGTELLLEDMSFAQESAALIQSSSENVIARMRFFRQTFGLSKQDDDQTENYLKTFSMPFSLDGACDDNLKRSLVMALTDYFYKGAQITFLSDKLIATGAALKDITPLKDILLLGQGDVASINAPAFYAYAFAKKEHKILQFKQSENTIEIRILMEDK